MRASTLSIQSILCVSALALVLVGSSASAQLDRLVAPVASIVEAPQAAAPRGVVVPEKEAPRDPLLFTGSDLLQEIKTQIADRFSLKGELVLEFSRPWAAIKLPASDAVVTVTDFPREGMTSSLLVRCKVVSGGVTVGEWQVSLRAHLWQQVWVATVGLDRGQALEDSMVTEQKVDVLLNRNALLTVENNPSLYEVVQSVSAGSPLTKRQVTEKPIIRKNQIVEVTANRGAIAINMKAQALENGAAKALIKMRNLDSRREFNAQVVDETHVNVLF